MKDAALERYTVPGLQRGLQLLAEFRKDTPALTGAELARRLGLPRASVFRLLQTLELMGFVERAGDSNHYRLGIAVLRLGFEFLASMDLTERGKPVLDALSHMCGLSAHLVVRDGTEVVFVAKSIGQSSLQSSVQVGTRLPAHATSTGRMLLACKPVAERNTWLKGRVLQRLTAHTVTTAKQLRAVLEQVRADDHCLASEEHEVGVFAVAVALRNIQGQALAALNVVLPGACTDRARTLAQWLPPLQQAARELRPLV